MSMSKLTEEQRRDALIATMQTCVEDFARKQDFDNTDDVFECIDVAFRHSALSFAESKLGQGDPNQLRALLGTTAALCVLLASRVEEGA